MANVTLTLQTEDGLIWIGTDGAGLISYDGQEFKEFNQSGVDSDHHVTSLFESNNILYFTSKYKGLFKIEKKQISQVVTKNSKIGDFISSFKNGDKLFLITTQGIYKVENKSCVEIARFPSKNETIKINSIININKGTIILTNQGNYFLSTHLERLSPLNNWLHVSKQSVDFIRFGVLKGEKIIFYNDQLTQQLDLILNESHGIYQLNFISIPSPLKENERIISVASNKHNGKIIALSDLNALFQNQSKGFSFVPHNSTFAIETCQHAMIDYYGDIWISSSSKGLYRAAIQPFTKLQLHPLFSSTSIMTIFKSKNDVTLISSLDNGTSISKNHSSDFETFNFFTTSVCEINNKLYLGTKEGLKIYNTTTHNFEKSPILSKSTDAITFVFSSDASIWIGIAGKGIKQFSKKTFQELPYKTIAQLPDYFYTAQENAVSQTIYFGTNNGLYKFSKKKNTFELIKTQKKLGSYFGVSTKDKHSTIWFTGEKGIFGILKNGELISVTDPKLFSSTLFYTLNSDRYGNIILGTNKGLIFLEVNKNGVIKNHRWYQGKGGFDGYETNMRSQFQNRNSIYVGTVEGLYSINTQVLYSIKPPIKPIIEIDKLNAHLQSSNSLHFRFSVNNPKINTVLYSYRIKGSDEGWSEFDSKNELFLTDLSSGNYILEVKASYNGFVESSVSSFNFTVDLPFWKTRWFIFVLLFALVIINLYFIQKNRSLSTGKVFGSNESSVIVKMTPQAVLFGLITDTATNLIGPLLDPTLYSNLGLTLSVGFILFALLLLAQSAKNNERQSHYKYILALTFGIILAHNFIGLYFSNIQPFYLIAIVLIYSTAPFIFNEIKTILIFTLLFILASCAIALIIDTPVYSKPLFLIAIVISGVISVFAMYLRFDSLEKLLFISGVINKGDVIAISFNAEGYVTYASENVDELLKINQLNVVGKHISFLNHFVPEEGNYRGVDLTENFEDGKKYLTPMISQTNDINWLEWSCKIFNDNVRVILGHNVTERIQLESTYELLVQNAEDLIYQCDVNGFYQFLNQRCFEKLGYTKEEMLGRNSMEFIPVENVVEVNQFYRNHFEQRIESSYLEFPVKTKDGQVIWLGQYVTTLYKPGSKNIINGFLALGRDITTSREQQKTIQQQRDDITASINYAQKIQVNLLPNNEKFEHAFGQSCVIYKPKDIVSGDFYWLEQIDEFIIFALADCTGHGVPGSFMTLLGINLLNNIVLEKRTLHPSAILDELDKRLMTALPRENGEENMNDGMEITICVFNPKNNELSYACAGSRFLVYDNNSFTMHKGDSKHIGDRATETFSSFTTHHTKFNPTATLYLFTDGFQDQFGGVKNKKYSFRRMIELFEANIRLPLEDQHHMIETEFDKWKSDDVQTDDVTIIALRHPKIQS
jgi:PAS domain S-box-containing protein